MISNFGPALTEVAVGGRPTALILSPGAALGSWQGGFLYALEKELGLNFHSVLGTSAGSLNGAAYLQDRTSLLRDIWRDMDRRRFMRLAPRFSPPSVFSGEALRSYLAEIIDEAACRERRRCWFYAVSVDIANGRLCQAQYSPEPGGPWEGPLVDHVLGSSSVPFLFPPACVPGKNGDRAKLLIDGAVTSFCELTPLVERGARDFLFVNVIDTATLGAPGLSPRGFISTLIHQLLKGLVVNSLAPLRPLAEKFGLRAFEFNPSRPLDIGVFSFDKEECRRSFDLGVEDAHKYLREPEGYRIL